MVTPSATVTLYTLLELNADCILVTLPGIVMIEGQAGLLLNQLLMSVVPDGMVVFLQKPSFLPVERL